MKASTFMDAAASSTRVIGRKDDVRVIFEGTNAQTDGDVVSLPAIPALADVGEEEADVIRGYRDHESMHVRCTDMKMIDRLSAISNDKLLYQLSQYCEDIRIENAGVQSYPGMRRTFSATNREAASLIEESIKEAGLTVPEAISKCPPDKAMLIALQAEARREVGIDIGFYDEFLQHIDPQIHDFAKKWAKEMVNLTTGVDNGNLDSAKSRKHTADALSLANRIKQDYTDELVPELEKEPGEGEGDPQGQGGQPGRQGQGQGGQPNGGQPGGPGTSGDGPGAGNGQSGDGGGDGGNQSSDGDGGTGEGAGGGQKKSGTMGDGQPGKQTEAKDAQSNGSQSKGKQGGGKGGDTSHDSSGMNTEMFDTDYKDALRNIIEEIEQDAASKLAIEHGKKTPAWRVFSDRLRIKASIHDIDPNAYPKGKMPSFFTDRFNTAHAAVKDRAAMIRRTIELELQARFDRVWQPGHKSGRLHSPRLVDAMNGMENVYQKRESGRDIDTLLVMSVDGSGSMSGERMSRCQELAIAFGDALERTGADIEVEIWDDSMPRDAATQARFNIEDPRAVYQRYNQANLDAMNAESKRRYGVSDWRLVPDAHKFMVDWEDIKPRIWASYGQIVRRVVKSRRQRMTDPNTRAALGAMISLAGGGTPMIDAVTWTVLDMIKEKHGKKILLVMTDGIPNGGNDFDDFEPHIAQMKYLHKLADEHGIHIIGVGIQADVSEYFRDYVSVRNSNAYEKVMKKIASHLREERRAVRRKA